MDNLSVGSTPNDEDCAQVGHAGYAERARRECTAYVHQLERAFPDRPAGVTFRVATNRHDFGTYLDVQVVYDEADEEAVDFAFRVEEHAPARWDERARAELGL